MSKNGKGSGMRLIIKIDGLMAPKKSYQNLFNRLRFRVAQIQGLGITREQVIPYVNPHIIQEGAEEGGVFVYLESDKPVRDPMVRQELTDAVYDFIYVFVKATALGLRFNKFIEVFSHIDIEENSHRGGKIEWD
ncbi:MAG: hypothetical protein US30_C0013G0075 [Candidatus Moranbacteria bacterium GW2011_GWF2_36_839]|nr:MAG: hypothetical protein US27_C0013G0075 [Candidatus Moranbacteria bacterium GW2011_GWF1_36_78]KKQ16678.1 MAG: hypothetical protein US30_C0013G0075 [Candidatus Moranbacteria bacterium GW2011_GWF2_36_839]HAT73575.1 hypothetical protein [Candidatus Moranbacteria bacterium]HBY11449.1 hypothetical protein [Candidatus Moranbacteria bacterium]